MADVFAFIPRSDLDAAENVTGFVTGCRELKVFGDDFEFDADNWNVTAYVNRRGKTSRQSFRFSNFGTCRSRTKCQPMAEPFKGFAKAKMLYDFVCNPNENHSQKLAALRVLEKALVANSSDSIPRVEDTDVHTLNLAANYLKMENPGSAFQSGCHLELIGKFLVKKQLVRKPFQWKNIIPRRPDHTIRIDEESEERRKQNLPSKAAIRALPQIYAHSVDPRDIVITAITAIMFSVPERFNVIFALPEKCEYTDKDSNGKEVYGLRLPSSKGADPMPFRILESMKEICKEAIKRLRKETATARAMVRWYQANPCKLYLPKGYEHLRDEKYITADDLASLVGQANAAKETRWAKENGLEPIDLRPSDGIGAPVKVYHLEDVEKVVVAMLPSGFPVYDKNFGMSYSDALLIVPRNFFHERRSMWLCMFQMIDINTFNNQLGSGEIHGKRSIFSRNNYMMEDGSPITMNSHDFRHYLNYLAQRKNVDQLTIALWSARKKVSQNKSYDNRSKQEKLVMLSQAGTATMASLEMIGLDINDPETADAFQTRKDILQLEYQYVHETRYGYCVHDYSMMPCHRMMACLDCTEHLCLKGDEGKTGAVKEALRQAEADQAKAEKAIAQGIFGADIYYEFNQKKITRLRQLVAIMDDPAYEAGTIIRLTEGADSSLEIAVNNRIALADADGLMLKEAMQQVEVVERRAEARLE